MFTNFNGQENSTKTRITALLIMEKKKQPLLYLHLHPPNYNVRDLPVTSPATMSS